MSDCSDFPTAQTAKTFKLDAGTQNEVVTKQQDRTDPASDGKTKKTFWGIENDATLQREEIEELAEAQRENLESTFTAQFAYKRIGNISLYVGDSLSEVDKLNSYQYPDDSGEWYGPVQNQSFPIIIPADPSTDEGWALVTAATQDWVIDNFGGSILSFDSVIDMQSFEPPVGKVVRIEDRNNAEFEVTLGGTADGFSIIDAGLGNTAVLSSSIIDPMKFGAVQGQESHAALTAFNDYALNQSEKRVNYIGSYIIGQKLTIGVGSNEYPTPKDINFDLNITTNYTSEEEAISIDGLATAFCSGQITVNCGSSDYSTRRNYDGFIIERCQRATLPDLTANGVKRQGQRVSGGGLTTNNLARFGLLKTANGGGQIAINATSFTNTGSPNNATQKTIITVDAVPEALSIFDIINDNGQPHNVVDFDSVTGTITVAPWILNPSVRSMTAIVGGGAELVGGDSSIMSIDKVDCRNVGTIYKPHCLYPPTVSVVHGSTFGAAMTIGRANNSVEGGSIGLLYAEVGTYPFSIIETSSFINSLTIESIATFTQEDTWRLALGNDGVSHKNSESLINVLSWGGEIYARSGTAPNNAQKTTSSKTLRASPLTMVQNSVYRNNQTVNLPFITLTNNTAGNEAFEWLSSGTGANGSPAGVTVNPPSGYTVNGGASLVVALSGMAVFYARYDFASLNIQVSHMQLSV